MIDLKEFKDGFIGLCEAHGISDEYVKCFSDAMDQAIDAESKLAELEKQERAVYAPFLSDRADGVKGHYAIGRYNGDHFEYWNLVHHKWSAFSDKILTYDEAITLLKNSVIPTKPSQQIANNSEPVQHITEQDAREIMFSLMQNKDLKFSEWLDGEGRTLLAKLNEHREPEPKERVYINSAIDEFILDSQIMLDVSEVFVKEIFKAGAKWQRSQVTANKAEVPHWVEIDNPEDAPTDGNLVLWDGCDLSVDYVENEVEFGTSFFANGTEATHYLAGLKTPLPPLNNYSDSSTKKNKLTIGEVDIGVIFVIDGKYFKRIGLSSHIEVDIHGNHVGTAVGTDPFMDVSYIFVQPLKDGAK